MNWDAIDNGKVKRAAKDASKDKELKTISEDKEDDDETEATDNKTDVGQEHEDKDDKNELSESTQGFGKKDKPEEVMTEDKEHEADEKKEVEEPTFITEKKEDDISGKFADGLLMGFKEIDIKIIPLSDDVEKLSTKKKFQGLFDVIANGFLHAVSLKSDHIVKLLVKDTGFVIQENAQ